MSNLANTTRRIKFIQGLTSPEVLQPLPAFRLVRFRDGEKSFLTFWDKFTFFEKAYLTLEPGYPTFHSESDLPSCE